MISAIKPIQNSHPSYSAEVYNASDLKIINEGKASTAVESLVKKSKNLNSEKYESSKEQGNLEYLKLITDAKYLQNYVKKILYNKQSVTDLYKQVYQQQSFNTYHKKA